MKPARPAARAKGVSMTTTDNRGRVLIWVPIIHTPADLGSLSETIRQLHLRAFGQGKWDRHLQTVEEMWRHIKQDIDTLNLDFSQVRLYQDGLPCCGHEADIVRDLAQAGSQNHLLLLDLMKKGARVTGTESPELLLEEYELARQVLAAAGSGKPRRSARRQQELSKLLLERRDRFIAAQIDKTLAAGETGLVFLGMLHNLEGRLAADIALIRAGLIHHRVTEGTEKTKKN